MSEDPYNREILRSTPETGVTPFFGMLEIEIDQMIKGYKGKGPYAGQVCMEKRNNHESVSFNMRQNGVFLEIRFYPYNLEKIPKSYFNRAGNLSRFPSSDMGITLQDNSTNIRSSFDNHWPEGLHINFCGGDIEGTYVSSVDPIDSNKLRFSDEQIEQRLTELIRQFGGYIEEHEVEAEI